MDLTVLRISGAPPKECLENALGLLDKAVLEAVQAILYEAKVEEIQAELRGRQIDYLRELKERTKLSSSLKKLRRFF